MAAVEPDDDLEVLAANRRYYAAFEAADLDAMSELWWRTPEAVCTHPGWATLRGWGQIAASFYALFQTPDPPQFVLTREQAMVGGDMAWVSVDENLLGVQGGVTVAAVNVFVRRRGGWRLVCHHGSVVQETVDG